MAAGGAAQDVVPVDLALEVAVLAQLQLGDGARARAIHDEFVERFPVDRTTLRYQLLAALVGMSID